MAGHVPRDLAASGGMAIEGNCLNIDFFIDSREMVGIPFHVFSFGRLARPSMATSVMGDDAKTVLRQEKHLAIPRVRTQRPAVRKSNDRALAPVLVINLR